MEILETTLIGGVVGAVYGVMGYIKNNSVDEPLDFKWSKFFPTVILTALAGLVIGSTGKLPDDPMIAGYLAAFGTIGIDRAVETFIKMILK